jgi:hypothetical protein
MRNSYLVSCDICDDKRLQQVFQHDARRDFGSRLRYGKRSVGVDRD